MECEKAKPMVSVLVLAKALEWESWKALAKDLQTAADLELPME